MHPILFRIPLPGGGHFEIATYGAMLALATIFGAFVAVALARRDGVSRDGIIDITFWAVLCGIIGAKIWFIVQFWDTYADKLDLLRTFRGGLVYYGGLVGGAGGALACASVRKMPFLRTLDVVAPSGALGLFFGRLGCFFNGCCYGKLADSPLAIRFPAHSPAFYDQLDAGLVAEADKFSLPVFPSQLFASAFALAIFAILLLLRRTRKFYGEQISLLFAIYAVSRFVEELFRGDNPPFAFGLSVAQVFSVFMFSLGAATLLYLRVRRPGNLAVAPVGG